MRNPCTLLLALFALAPGCGSDGPAGSDMIGSAGQDLSVSSSLDLTAANDDLSTLTGCHGLALCIGGCKGSASCQTSCRADATTVARKLYRKLTECRFATCFPQPDGGAEPCALGTAPSASCTLCLKDADTAPGTCTGGGTPSWCGACYQQLTACAADLP